MSTFYQLPDPGVEVNLVTHLTIREDAHILYGFCSKKDRTLFRQLIKVNSIGPRSAIGILSAMDYDQFIATVASKNVATLIRIPGIGKKTAERLLLEMQDKLGEEIHALPMHTTTGKSQTDDTSGDKNTDYNMEEARQALVTLGYKMYEADKALKKIDVNTALSSQEIIRLALRKM